MNASPSLPEIVEVTREAFEHLAPKARVAIAFSTKDRVELSRRSITSLQPDGFDLFVVDGSNTSEGQKFAETIGLGDNTHCYANVRGGADAAIAFSLTTMLNHPNNYAYVGLVENDVLLDPDWFKPTMHLFERGIDEDIPVGAVSARCYEDRVLIQRDGYAVCHNTGAGMVIFSREAAKIVLKNFRTGWWPENRRIFAQLSGIDIGRYAAFRANEQHVTADWYFDAVLAQHGLASLALTPSPVEMIGQIPPLHEQGLKLVTQPVELLRDDSAFARYAENLGKIRAGVLRVADRGNAPFHRSEDGSLTIFPHQVFLLGGVYDGDWRLKWSQGFGPFAYRAAEMADGFMQGMPLPRGVADLTVNVSGPCSFLVSGGQHGGRIEAVDCASGYKVAPELPPEGEHTRILNLVMPAGVSYRQLRLTALSPGVCFYGITTREPQPWADVRSFDHSQLPPV